jgi:hypothetical protein
LKLPVRKLNALLTSRRAFNKSNGKRDRASTTKIRATAETRKCFRRVMRFEIVLGSLSSRRRLRALAAE